MDRSITGWLQVAQGFVARHRRGIVAGVVVALGGFGVTAFGIAPLAPDAALLPQRVITETLEPVGLAQQVDALSSQPLALLRHDITRSTDSAESLLSRLGVSDASAAAFLRQDATARRLLAGRGGKLVQVSAGPNGELVELVARFPAERAELARSHFTRMTIAGVPGAPGRWLARVETAPLVAAVRLGSGTIRSSLFAATDDALLPDAVAVQMAEIFSTEIDFHRELRKGDTFSVVYESLTADGEVVPWNEGVGRVLAAEFVNGGRTHQALWFDGAGGRGGYFGPNGESKRRSFLTSPMEFSRMTSGFAMRLHPILQTWRKHLGVDYGAPTGTPVRTVGDGLVEFAGWQNGYGNVVQIAHGNARSTLYAHLSRIDVKRGQRVDQGQRIGAVGSTGWSTGPHLHFEFRVNGAHQDPVKIAKASEPVTLEPAARAKFAELAPRLQAQLGAASTLLGTTVSGE